MRSSSCDKLDRLTAILKKIESAVIAFSGGVDSTLLLKTAAITGVRALAVTGYSPTMPEQDLCDAMELAKNIGADHRVIETSELHSRGFSDNPPDRCFYCKDELFGKLRDISLSEGYGHVLDGSNTDDLGDWRPGRKAALKHGVRSPLIEAGLGKKEIRELSLGLNLPTWDRPSSPCLSSRFPYGEPITAEALRCIEEAEKFLKSLGFREFRVRHHKDIARIETVEGDFNKIFDPPVRAAVSRKFKSLGYKYIVLDLEGFRSGRLNDYLTK